MKKLYAFLLCSIISCATSTAWSAEKKDEPQMANAADSEAGPWNPLLDFSQPINLLTQNQDLRDCLHEALNETQTGVFVQEPGRRGVNIHAYSFNKDLTKILPIIAAIDMVTLKNRQLEIAQEQIKATRELAAATQEQTAVHKQMVSRLEQLAFSSASHERNFPRS